MPYRIQKRGDRHVVVKEDGQPVPGGAHRDRASALRHLKALYANVRDVGRGGAMMRARKREH